MSSSNIQIVEKLVFETSDVPESNNQRLSPSKLDFRILKNNRHELTVAYNNRISSIDSQFIRKFIFTTLTGICEINDSLFNEDKDIFELVKHQAQTPFFTNYIDDMQFSEFLSKIIEESEIQLSTLILAMIYLNHFIERNNYFLIKNNFYK